MERSGFVLETVTTSDGNKKRYISIHDVDGVTYVTFYKGDRLIPIPYDCLVQHTSENIRTPKKLTPNVAALEKLIIDSQTKE